MSQKEFKAEYTQGNIKKIMFRSALAMLPATLAMSGYNITDTFFVGRIGSEIPLAAMGYTFPVIMLVNCVFYGLGSGSMTNLAHALGRRDAAAATCMVSSGILLKALVSFFLAILGVLFADFLYVRLGAQGETLVQVRAYMNVWFAGCVTAAIAHEGSKILIAAGSPKMSSFMTVVGMLINVILDPIFIFGLLGFPAMGIKGAAIATVISQAIAAVVILIILYRRKLLSFHCLTRERLFHSWKLIISYGLPAMLGMLLVPFANSIITKITAEFGDVAVAGVSAASRIEMLAFVFPMALGTTLMPILAQNYGAKLYTRVKDCLRFSLNFGFFFLLFAGILMAIFAPRMVTFFTPEESVQKIMIIYLRIIPFGLGMVECMRFAGFALIACGHPKIDAWLKAFRILIIHIPLSVLALQLHSLPGVFYARLSADIAGGISSMLAAWIILKGLENRE